MASGKATIPVPFLKEVFKISAVETGPSSECTALEINSFSYVAFHRAEEGLGQQKNRFCLLDLQTIALKLQAMHGMPWNSAKVCALWLCMILGPIGMASFIKLQSPERLITVLP